MVILVLRIWTNIVLPDPDPVFFYERGKVSQKENERRTPPPFLHKFTRVETSLDSLQSKIFSWIFSYPPHSALIFPCRIMAFRVTPVDRTMSLHVASSIKRKAVYCFRIRAGKCKAKPNLFSENILKITIPLMLTINKYNFFRFCNICKTWDRIRIWKSESDPDRHQNDADPQHWIKEMSLGRLQ
jgi:hypothetical protein